MSQTAGSHRSNRPPQQRTARAALWSVLAPGVQTRDRVVARDVSAIVGHRSVDACRSPDAPPRGSAARLPLQTGAVEPRSAETIRRLSFCGTVRASQRAGADPSPAPARSVHPA
jgi:hypothetical protein